MTSQSVCSYAQRHNSVGPQVHLEVPLLVPQFLNDSHSHGKLPQPLPTSGWLEQPLIGSCERNIRRINSDISTPNEEFQGCLKGQGTGVLSGHWDLDPGHLNPQQWGLADQSVRAHVCLHVHTRVYTHRHTHIHRQTDSQTDSQTDIHTYIHIYIYIYHLYQKLPGAEIQLRGWIHIEGWKSKAKS